MQPLFAFLLKGYPNRQYFDPSQADGWADTPFGSRQLICQPRISGQAQGIWHGLFDETQGKLLGQRANGKLVRQLKNERVYGERFETRDEVIAMTFEYIEVFYNRKRLHSTLGYKSLMQFLDDWFTAQQYEKLVA